MILNRSVRRRECLATLLGLAGTSFAAGPKFRGPLGVQLYTLRDALEKDPEAAIKALSQLGYKEVEASLHISFGREYPLLKKYNLNVVSGHIEPPLITGDWSAWKEAAATRPKSYNWETAVEEAYGAGLKYMVFPYLQVAERGGADFYKQLADKVNHAAPLCKKAGMKMGFHNHAFEFQKVDGVRPFDILMERLDPKLVTLEMDVFWVSMAGEDPVALLKQYPGRVELLHLKDRAKGIGAQFSDGAVPHDAYKEVGSGSLDFPAILAAAKKAGVKHYFVEQDYCAGDPIDSLRKSYQYLRSA